MLLRCSSSRRPRSTPGGNDVGRLDSTGSQREQDSDNAGTFLTSIVDTDANAGNESNDVDAETARRRALLLGPSKSEQARADLRAHLTSLTERKDSDGNNLVSFSEHFIRQVHTTLPQLRTGNAATADSDDGSSDEYSSDYDGESSVTDEEIEEEPAVAHISAALERKTKAKKEKKRRKNRRRRKKSEKQQTPSHPVRDTTSTDTGAEKTLADRTRPSEAHVVGQSTVASPMHFIEEIEEDPTEANKLVATRPTSALLVAEVVGQGSGEAGADDHGSVQELQHWQAAVAAQNLRRSEIMGPSKSDKARAELRAHLASLTSKVAFSEDFVAEVKVRGSSHVVPAPAFLLARLKASLISALA